MRLPQFVAQIFHFAPRQRRLFLVCALSAIGLLALPASGETVVTDALIEAVAQIESSGGRHMIGDGGKAIGCWQMHQAAWKDTSDFRKRRGLPTWSYKHAPNPKVAKVYARDYLIILEAQLRNALGRDVTVEMIYAAYNVGFSRFQSLRFLIQNTPRTTQAACARLGQLIAPSPKSSEKTADLAKLE